MMAAELVVGNTCVYADYCVRGYFYATQRRDNLTLFSDPSTKETLFALNEDWFGD